MTDLVHSQRRAGSIQQCRLALAPLAPALMHIYIYRANGVPGRVGPLSPMAGSTPPEGPKAPQEYTKTAPVAPRAAQDGPPAAYDARKTPRDGHQTAQEASRTPREGPRSVRKRPKAASRRATRPSRRPKRLPRGLPRGPQEAKIVDLYVFLFNVFCLFAFSAFRRSKTV